MSVGYQKKIIDKVDKVDIQAKNQGYQLFLDNLRFCSGYQGYQGYQLVSGDKLTQYRTNKTGGTLNLYQVHTKDRMPPCEQFLTGNGCLIPQKVTGD